MEDACFLSPCSQLMPRWCMRKQLDSLGEDNNHAPAVLYGFLCLMEYDTARQEVPLLFNQAEAVLPL